MLKLSRIKPHPVVMVLTTVFAGTISYMLWDKLFLSFQHWYFRNYVQLADPHPPFLPFTWESFWLLPFLSAVTAGAILGALFRGGKRWRPLIVGLCLAIACLGRLFGFYMSRYVTVIVIGVAIFGSAGYYLVQLRTKGLLPEDSERN